jgi:type VI secretion system protein ImpG
MTDELLPYYNRELAFLRRMGAEFAQAHPKIAGRLRMGPDTVEDPHVSRLLEGVALLNARMRHKLDDDFPELTQALLEVLYPHYLAPLPSAAIVQFVLRGDLASAYEVASGTALETAPVDGEPCRFRTCGPATLWPIEIESAKLTGRPVLAPRVPQFASAVASLRMVLRCRSNAATFGSLAPSSLRFFLRGPMQLSAQLYELLLNDVVGVAVGTAPDDASPVVLADASISAAGFGRDEALFPWRAASFPGYRLLTEYFMFPQKFLFFDLTGLAPAAAAKPGGRIEVFFYLRRSSLDLEQNVAKDSFALGCVPVVNLYRHMAERIEVTHHEAEYRVVPDARRPMSTEVWSIDRVTATTADGDEEEFAPFYSVRHATRASSRARFFQTARRPSTSRSAQRVNGTDVFLTLVDLELRPSAPEGRILVVETTCLNRDLPAHLPFGGNQPRIHLVEGGAPLDAVQCLTQPTPTLRPDLRHGQLWRIVSHLSLNHLSIVGGDEAADALREVLKLYDYRDSAETRATIDGVASVSSRESTARGPWRGHGGICRGTEVRVEFDAARHSANETFLLASVLERFFALYCSVNSFVRTVATVKGREGELRRWAPRAGEKTLL